MRGLLLTALGAIAALFLHGTARPTFAMVIGGVLGWLTSIVLRSSRNDETLARHEAELSLLRKRIRQLEHRPVAAPAPSAPPKSEEKPAPAVESVPQEEPPPAAPVDPPKPQAPPRQTAPPPRPAASEPEPSVVADLFERAYAAAVKWLTTGNIPVKVGVIISFIGVSFLLKWAVDRKLLYLPVELRLAGVALGGVALLVVGWRLREKMRVYALSLQGGGVGILYLTIFATYRIYELIPAGLAFALLVLLTAFSGILAVLQDARSLAFLGALGGFLAPILVSTGSGNHVALFTYYLVLNSAIFGIAFFRVWRELNLLGFLFIYGIGFAWGAQYYRPELLGSVLPFVGLFFLQFLGISILYAYRRATILKDYLDGTLVFGVPVVTFAMLARLLSRTEYGMAAAAAAAALIYVITASLLHRFTTPKHRMLVEAFLALGVGLGTIAIPLALDARWTSAVWALEGVALIWVGVRQGRALARASGMALAFAGGAAFFGRSRVTETLPVVNGDYLGTLMISLSSLFASFYLERNRQKLYELERPVSIALLLWGVGWWFLGGLLEIEAHVPTKLALAAVLLFVVASPAIGMLLSRRLDWKAIAWPAFAVVPALGLLAILDGFLKRHPFEETGWVAWPLALAGSYWTLHRLESLYLRSARWIHAPLLWLLTAVAGRELAFHVRRFTANSLWANVAIIVFLCLVITAVLRVRRDWPLVRHRPVFRTAGVGPLFAVAFLLLLGLNGTPADPAPLPYVPVLNPLDLAGAFFVVVLGIWLLEFREHDARLRDRRFWWNAAALVAFVLATATVVRTVHHWAGVPFDGDTLFRSVVLQATLSLFWGLVGLAAMVTGSRLLERNTWIAGASLMGLVVVKLLLVDLGNSGTLARVFSFLGVGVLLLVVGYFAGVPPRQEAQEDAA